MPLQFTTSMHSDFLKGAQTELESITGYIVQCAKDLNIEVPVISKCITNSKQIIQIFTITPTINLPYLIYFQTLPVIKIISATPCV